MTKFLKNVGCQQFRKHYFQKWSKALASRSLSFSYFEILFSKTHSFQNFVNFVIRKFLRIRYLYLWSVTLYGCLWTSCRVCMAAVLSQLCLWTAVQSVGLLKCFTSVCVFVCVCARARMCVCIVIC